MSKEDILTILLIMGALAVLAIAFIALTAGNIVNQIFSPVPSIGGPLGAAVALIVFVYLLGKGAGLVSNWV